MEKGRENSSNENTSEGLNQLFEVINAKGDSGEIKQIVNNDSPSTPKK